MAARQVELGETFCKAGSPLIVWIVDRIKLNAEHEHAELTRLDEPTTRITVSVDALTNSRFFVRSVAEPG